MEKIEQNEEEISLIDLLAVIIKYRKMIILKMLNTCSGKGRC